jgi:uncharacterized repeat protein (TIGR03803 family)
MKRSWFVLLAVLCAAVACCAQTYTETVLYSFPLSPEGYYYYPTNLVRDSAGNLYGVTLLGGIKGQNCGQPNALYGCGTIFEFSTGGLLSTLYQFTGLSDGYEPCCLAMDNSGNLYGTTYSGGLAGGGTVFKYATKTKKFSTLHEFGRVANDGLGPNGPLTLATDGNLYGTTQAGGVNGAGTIFEVTPKGVESVHFSFEHSTGSPLGNVLRNSQGDFYGVQGYDDATLGYVLYEVNSSGVATVLNSMVPTQYTQGGYVARSAAGNFYGDGETGLWEVVGSNDTFAMYDFAGLGYLDGLPLLLNGNVYGVTAIGGANGYGAVYEFNESSGVETVLHNFTNTQYPPDGANPEYGLIADPQGNLYGTTDGGGTASLGTIYTFTKN